jgi:prophage DNA circulation protein
MPAIINTSTPEWILRLTGGQFRDAWFHVESVSRQSGRRIALHEFPKKESPYAEDMGRRAMRFAVRAYIVTYPMNVTQDVSGLLQKDYRLARDRLQNRLDDGKPGPLTIPGYRALDAMPRPITVKCEQYSMVEEERLGGFCRFDIMFVEFGISPNKAVAATQNAALAASTATINAAVQNTIPDTTGAYTFSA